MKKIRIVAAISTAILAATLTAQSGNDKVNNWRAEHSQDKTASTNIKIDRYRGLESTGTPAKAVWNRTFTTAGTYSFRIKYTPLPDRDMTFTLNGAPISLKGLNAKTNASADLDCEKAQWRTLGDYKFTQGINVLVAQPTNPNGKLPHICQFEAILQ